MKVLQTIGGFGMKSGGTSTSTYDLLKAINLKDENSEIDLLTPDVKDVEDKLMGNEEKWINKVQNDYISPISYSKNIKNFLKKTHYDIYHTNGLWMYVNHITCAIAKKKSKPYIITPHGMLYPQALARSAWKKWPLKKIWFNKDISNATALHVTSQEELQHVRNYGYKGPIALIENPIFIPDYTLNLFQNHKPFKNSSTLQIGFLGRLHPIKGLENLLKALTLTNSNINLTIMGTGDPQYEIFINKEINRLNLKDKVNLIGFVKGKEKYQALSQLDALFVPSIMENFGMIIPEALIVGTPVMASFGTPWKSLNKINCGWWAANTPETIANIIEVIDKLSPEALSEMGKRGRNFVLENFDSIKVGAKMKLLYEWILGLTPKPDFVYLD